MDVRIILFVAMLLAYLLHLHLVDRVRLALQERHADLWSKLAGQASFTKKPIYDFIYKRRDKSLNDADLSRRTASAQLLLFVMLCGFVVWVILVIKGV